MSWRTKTFEDDLPALSIRGPELRKSLRTVTVAWMYGVVWFACISSSHVPIFNRALGFNDFHFGLLAAMPFLATFGQLIAAIIIERTGLRKYQFLFCAIIHRALWLLVALVPLVFDVPSNAAVFAMLAIALASWFIESLGRPAWTTWMGDLIPRRVRGRFFAVRARWSGMVMILAVILLGLLIDKNAIMWQYLNQWLHLGLDLDKIALDRLLLYSMCGIFFIGGLFVLVDILLFYRVRELIPTSKQAAPPMPMNLSVRGLLLDPLKDRVFRHYVGYGATVAFTINMSGIYFWLFAKENLLFSALAINLLFMAVGPLADMSAAMLWGKLIDRLGRRPVLIISTFGTLLSSSFWLFMTPNMPHPQFVESGANWIAGMVGSMFGQADWKLMTPDQPCGAYLLAVLGCIVGGASWSGVNLAQLNIMLGFSDGSGRSKYVAASGVLISIGGFMGGIFGGLITHYLKDLGPIGPFLWGNLHVVFALSIIIRLLAIRWLSGMPDPGASSVWYLFQQIRINIYNGVQSRWLYPLRIFGWSRPGQHHEDKKE